MLSGHPNKEIFRYTQQGACGFIKLPRDNCRGCEWGYSQGLLVQYGGVMSISSMASVTCWNGKVLDTLSPIKYIKIEKK